MCFFRKYPAEFKAEVERLSADLLRIGNVEDFLSERPAVSLIRIAGIFAPEKLVSAFTRLAASL